MAASLQRSILSRNSRLFLRKLLLISGNQARTYVTKDDGFFGSLLGSDKVSAHKSAHSTTLTQNKVIYEIQFESIKPEFKERFLENTSLMNTKLSNNTEFPGKLLGSWTTLIGDLNEAVHLWVYDEGYKAASNAIQYKNQNQEYVDYSRQRGEWLNKRSNQLLHEFSFWGSPEPRPPTNIYELRSYSLKPGTLIEWGNKWGQAFQIRRKDAVGGFFSQIGELYQVHYIWAYKDLEHRRAKREQMWNIPGWDDLVAGTVPLIRTMEARVLQPIKDSPMQ